MQLKNWELYFPLEFDMNEYHRIIGAFSDFIEGVVPGDSFELNGVCCVRGQLFKSSRTKKGVDFYTEPIIKVVRPKNTAKRRYDFAIKTQLGTYFAMLGDINPKFRKQIWTYGTPHATGC